MQGKGVRRAGSCYAARHQQGCWQTPLLVQAMDGLPRIKHRMCLIREAEPGHVPDSACGESAGQHFLHSRPNMSGNRMSLISAPVSYGELIDKITMLEIKSERMTDAAKLANVRDELQLLNALWVGDAASRTDIAAERAELKRINEALWEIEDEIRVKERGQAFDARFIELARAVYHTNDKRAAVKRAINLKLGSRLVEEKSYQDYGAA